MKGVVILVSSGLSPTITVYTPVITIGFGDDRKPELPVGPAKVLSG